MAVHRIDDNAECLLQAIAKREGKRPGEWLSQLIRDYAQGMEFALTTSDGTKLFLINWGPETSTN